MTSLAATNEPVPRSGAHVEALRRRSSSEKDQQRVDPGEDQTEELSGEASVGGPSQTSPDEEDGSSSESSESSAPRDKEDRTDDLSPYFESFRYRPWADKLLRSYAVSDSTTEDIIFPTEWSPGNRVNGLNLIHDFDSSGFVCSRLVAGARDEEFWQYIRVSSQDLCIFVQQCYGSLLRWAEDEVWFLPSSEKKGAALWRLWESDVCRHESWVLRFEACS
jgi:hypothetical protein